MHANKIIQELRNKKNLYKIECCGNKKLWFGIGLPEFIDKNKSKDFVTDASVELPYHHFIPVSSAFCGWMSYWQHFGPRCNSGTVFIQIEPLNKQIPAVEVYKSRLDETSNKIIDNSYFVWEEEYYKSISSGLISGLKTIIDHPVADVKITILGAIADEVESSQKSFENLGKWLMESMIIEMYKKDIFESVRHP